MTPGGLIYDSPFAMPEVQFKPEYSHLENKKFELLIEKPGRAKVYRIVLDKLRVIEESYKEINV